MALTRRTFKAFLLAGLLLLAAAMPASAQEIFGYNIVTPSSPFITSSQLLGNTFSFDYYYAELPLSFNPGSDQLRVAVNGPSGWTQLGVFSFSTGTNLLTGPRHETLDTSTYFGQNLQLRFTTVDVGGRSYPTAYVGNLAASPVPLPAAIWLLGPAAVGLVGLRRRFTNN